MKVHRNGVGVLSLVLFALVLALVGRGSAAPPAKEAETNVPPTRPSSERRLELPPTPYHYADIDLPAHFKTAAALRFDNTPRSNPVTDEGATLGRVLFHDTRLSANNTVACASCHKQEHAFTLPERFPAGFEGKRVDRNSMSLVNIRYYPRGRFFWDERAATLEEQALMPIVNKIEMGNDLDRVVAMLTKTDPYPELFRKAFGASEITKERIGKAIAQFLRSLVSYQSKYDEGMNQVLIVREDFPNFTAEENRGKRLFLGQCASCHLPGGQSAHFIMNRPRNNGLDSDVVNTDGGVGDITLRTGDMGLFKSPSLRNVEYTAPYMHDGRLESLEKVIDHYSKDVKPHPNVGGQLRRRLNFTDSEKAALVAFLKTLSDPKFIADPKFSDPFK
jgi:cytochrome c peroxidase